MPRGFHKPGEGPEPRRDDERPTQRDRPAEPDRPARRDREPDAPEDFRGDDRPRNRPPREPRPYDEAPPSREARPRGDDRDDRGPEPRIGRGYGTRHTPAGNARQRADEAVGRDPARDFGRGRGPAFGPPPREGRYADRYPSREELRGRDRHDDRRRDDRDRDRGGDDYRGGYDRRDEGRRGRDARDEGRRDDRYRDDRYREDRYREDRFGGDRYEERRHDDRRPPDHYRQDRGYGDRPPYQNPRDGYRYDDRARRDHRPPRRDYREDYPRRGPDRRSPQPPRERPPAKSDKRHFKPPAPPNLDDSKLDEPIRLNKFIARSTQHSRRESDDLVRRGRVTVNGAEASPGMMIAPGDVVLLDERPLHRRDHLVYILINKPREVQATTEAGEQSEGEPYRPKTLADVLKFDGADKLSAVAPLSADMLGLQLVSNDERIGEHFARHPPKETYTLTLAEPGTADLPEKLLAADAGEVEFLVAEYADEERAKLSLVTRRGFPHAALEHVGVEVERVDRLHFAGLTKKELPRGHWRFLSDREVTWVTMYQQ